MFTLSLVRNVVFAAMTTSVVAREVVVFVASALVVVIVVLLISFCDVRVHIVVLIAKLY